MSCAKLPFLGRSDTGFAQSESRISFTSGPSAGYSATIIVNTSPRVCRGGVVVEVEVAGKLAFLFFSHLPKGRSVLVEMLVAT